MNPQVTELILWLDWKMNYLFKALTQSKDAEVFPYQAVIIDLSASGMRFSTEREVKAKSTIEFEFILPVLPFREISLMGEVVRCVRSDKEFSRDYEVSIEFRQIKDPDREHIIRYVVKRQLQLQREERGKNREPGSFGGRNPLIHIKSFDFSRSEAYSQKLVSSKKGDRSK